MADPKLDDLLTRAAAAASVDPLAHMREMMRAVGVVKVAAGRGDGGGPIPVAVARRGDPFALVNAPLAAGFNLAQLPGQVPSQTLTPSGYPFGGNVKVLQHAPTGMQRFGQTQPWSISPTVHIPGTLSESPNPADSTQWVLDHIARQGSLDLRRFPASEFLLTALDRPEVPGQKLKDPCADFIAEAGSSLEDRIAYVHDVLAGFVMQIPAPLFLPAQQQQDLSDLIRSYSAFLNCLPRLLGEMGVQDPRLAGLSGEIYRALEESTLPLDVLEVLRIIVPVGKLLVLLSSYMSGREDPRAV